MIDVALRPTEVRAADLAVVIDVLRATSTVTQALASGYRRVLCVETIERARTLRDERRVLSGRVLDGRVLAGERSCVKPHGFDQGNSPIEALRRAGSELVLATTNGTPAVLAATGNAGIVLLACMLNLDTAVSAVLEHMTAGKLDVQIVCAGTDGAVSLEDAYVAGRISSQLPGSRTDAALVAEGVARAFPSPVEALVASADARTLAAAGMSEDVPFCAQESLLEVLPTVVSTRAGIAIVGLAEDCPGAAEDRAVDRLSHLPRLDRLGTVSP